MFPTLFYIFILFFEGLFNTSSKQYNVAIAEINQQVLAKNYKQALIGAKSIKKATIFVNPEIERLIAVLELKSRKNGIEKQALALNSQSMDIDILLSHFSANAGSQQKGLIDLQNSIKKNGNVDTLVKTYELYAFNFHQNKLKKQAKSTQMISQTQKINTQEALSLLDLMKKKQKNFIY
jgi:hypothetical protein